MSTEQRRVAVGYAVDTPQCCMCRKYRRARIERGELQPAWCIGHKFTVVPNACCDKFVDRKTGERLG